MEYQKSGHSIPTFILYTIFIQKRQVLSKKSISLKKKKFILTKQIFLSRQKVKEHDQLVFNENGKPVMIGDYISVTAENSKATDRAKAEIIVSQKGKKREKRMTLSEAIDKYIEFSDAILSPTTIAGYRTIQQYGFRSIIDTNIYDLTTEKLREAVNIKSRRPAARKKTPISAKTVANEYGLITAVLHSYYTDLDMEITLPQKSKQFHELSQPDEIFRIVAVRSSHKKLKHLLRDKSILDIIDMQHDLQHGNEKTP